MPINFSTNKDLLTELGYGSGGINDGWFQYLGSLGYTGSIDDRWRAFLRETYTERADSSVGDLMQTFFEDGGEVLSPLGTEIVLAAFTNDHTDNPPIFSARRELNSGMVWTEVTAAAADEPIVGRMVRADTGVPVSSWVDLGSTDGDGLWEGYITGAPRSFNALKAQVRYRDYSEIGETSNTCYVGWVLAGWGQSNFRWAGSVNVEDTSVSPIAATPGIDVRFITFDRAADDAAGTTSDLIVYEITGDSATDRQPVWAFGNVLADLLDDGPIIFMAHAVSGTSPLNSVDDSQAARNWSDEVLIAQAGQPHLIDQTRPVAIDLVWHNYTSSANWNTDAKSRDTLPRYLLGLNPDGTAVTRGATITTGAATWDADHFFTDLYRLDTILVAQREHPVSSTNEGFEFTADDAEVGQYFSQTIPAPTGYFLTNGSIVDDELVDGGHASNNRLGGYTNVAEQDAAGIAFALDLYPVEIPQWNYIKWPTEPEDDDRYIYVGFDGMDVETMRTILASDDPPTEPGTGEQPLGDVLGFVVNGVRTNLTTLVEYDGQIRVRIAKAADAAWTNADVLTYNLEDPIALFISDPVPIAEREALPRYLDFAGISTGLARPRLFPVQDRPEEALFTNIVPAPAGPSLEHLDSFNGATTTSPTSLGSVTSDGRPILIAMGTRDNSNVTNGTQGFPTAITLGGVDISGSLVARQDSQNVKGSAYYVATPATGSLELVVTMNNNTFANVFQLFHVADGDGVGDVSEVGVSASATITPALVSSAGDSMLVNVLVTEVPINSVSGGDLAASIQTVGSTLVAMAVATTVVAGVGEKTTSFSVTGFNDTVQLGVEILNS